MSKSPTPKHKQRTAAWSQDMMLIKLNSDFFVEAWSIQRRSAHLTGTVYICRSHGDARQIAHSRGSLGLLLLLLQGPEGKQGNNAEERKIYAFRFTSATQQYLLLVLLHLQQSCQSWSAPLSLWRCHRLRWVGWDRTGDLQSFHGCALLLQQRHNQQVSPSVL